VLVALLGAGLPALVACEALTGLSDYSKGECAGGRCDGGLLDQVSGDAGPEASSDAKIDAVGANPVSWANWPMPNYGDGGPGQAPRPQKLTPLDADVIRDDITGLEWRRTLTPPVIATQAEAECRKITTAGPWRAPKRIEAATLLDYAGTGTFYVNPLFDKVNANLWTTSEVRPFVGGATQKYWSVNVENGSVEAKDGNILRAVLCVRAK